MPPNTSAVHARSGSDQPSSAASPGPAEHAPITDRLSAAEVLALVRGGQLTGDVSHALQRWRQTWSRRPASVVAGLLAAGAVALLLVGWVRQPPPAIDAEIPRATAVGKGSEATPSVGSALAASSASDGSAAVPPGSAGSVPPPVGVVVDVAGAVLRPGLVHLAKGARVADALAAAGGPIPGADLERVNQATVVGDGGRVYVPRVGQVEVPVVLDDTQGSPAGGSQVGDGQAGSTVAGGAEAAVQPVDLNRATASDLDTLPGVGPSTADAIVRYRTEHGRFRRVEDLLDVPGIGDGKLAKLRPFVRV